MDEELAAQNEEQDDAGDDVAGVFVQVELRGDLPCALFHKDQEEGHKDHGKGIQLAQPRHDDGREAAPACQPGGNGVAHAAGQQIARQTADAAGNGHGADDDPLDVDTGVVGGVFAFAYHGDLIALLGVVHVQVHQHHQHHHDDDGQQVAVAADGGQPAGLGLVVDQAHVIGTLGGLPVDDGEGYQLHGDVVEHQSKEGLVGVPAGLEKRRDHAPKAARRNADDGAEGIQQPIGKVRAVDHHGGGGHSAYQHLPFGADVPEAHPEGGQHRKADAQKNGRIPQGDPGAPGRAYRAAPDAGVYAQGIHARHAHDDEGADHQRQQNGNQTDQRRTDKGHALPLDDMKQGFFGGYLTHASASLSASR